MFEGVILGVVQGIAEWLPVSSEGMITLIETNFFGRTGLSEIIRFALFLHLGTFFSALIYFRKDVLNILKSLVNFRKSSEEDKRILSFLIITTIIGGGAGYIILKVVEQFENSVEFSGRIITLLIGLLLLATAWLELRRHNSLQRSAGEVRLADSIILGLVQALAVLPGLSRSGLTVSTLLLHRVDDNEALRLSFLMSLPLVLVGNILLNGEMLLSGLSGAALGSLLASFIFGLLTIHALMKLTRRINFGFFVGLFGLLMILSAIV